LKRLSSKSSNEKSEWSAFITSVPRRGTIPPIQHSESGLAFISRDAKKD
jgi:hypothetical protein